MVKSAHYVVIVQEENMQMESQELPWRRNAAAVMVDAAGRVLLGKAPGQRGYWHFPQGGAMGEEDIEQTLYREVYEEVGIRKEAYSVTQSLEGLRYRYRPGHRRSSKWSGQQQTYFLLVCSREKPRTNLSQCKEFVTTRWTFPRDIRLDMFTPSKRKVIETVLSTFLGMTEEELNRPLLRKRGAGASRDNAPTALSGSSLTNILSNTSMKKTPSGKNSEKKAFVKAPAKRLLRRRNSRRRRNQPQTVWLRLYCF